MNSIILIAACVVCLDQLLFRGRLASYVVDSLKGPEKSRAGHKAEPHTPKAVPAPRRSPEILISKSYRCGLERTGADIGTVREPAPLSSRHEPFVSLKTFYFMSEENQNQQPIPAPEQADPNYKETLLLYNEKNGAIEAVSKLDKQNDRYKVTTTQPLTANEPAFYDR